MSVHTTVSHGKPSPRIGHMAYSGPPRIHTTDNMRDALRRRARWNLYADCERSPLGWEGRA